MEFRLNLPIITFVSEAKWGWHGNYGKHSVEMTLNSIPEDHSKQKKNLVMSLNTTDGFFKVNNFIVYCLLCVLQGMTFKKLLKDFFFKAQSKHLGAKLSIPVTVSSPELELGLEAHNRFGRVNTSKAWDTGQICVSAKNLKILEQECFYIACENTPVRGKSFLIKAGDIRKFLLYNFFKF